MPILLAGNGPKLRLLSRASARRCAFNCCPAQHPAALYRSMIWTEVRVVRGLAARNPLVTAFVLSLTVHLTVFGGWRIGKRLGWWEHQATWLLDWKKKLRPNHLQPALDQAKAQTQHEVPLTFVEVDPSIAAAEAPKEAKYYGAQNSLAANPDLTVDSAVPKADGQQTKVPKTETVPKLTPQPLQPAPPPEKPPEPPQPKPKAETPGDLAKAKPDQPPVIQRERPRNLVEARKRKMLSGEQMKQD